jgi:hypothetical protein
MEGLNAVGYIEYVISLILSKATLFQNSLKVIVYIFPCHHYGAEEERFVDIMITFDPGSGSIAVYLSWPNTLREMHENGVFDCIPGETRERGVLGDDRLGVTTNCRLSP